MSNISNIPDIQLGNGGSNPTLTLHKEDWIIKDIDLSLGRELVEKYHYSKGGSNTRVYLHGLFRKDSNICYGCAWWIPPTKSCAINSYGGDWTKVLTLSRLVCVPEAPKLAAGFLLGNSIRIIKKDKRFECLITYADTYQNHEGTIYKATNWEYIGLTKPQPIWVDSNNRMVARKSGPKTRTKLEMKALGYKMIGNFPKHKFRIVLASNANK